MQLKPKTKICKIGIAKSGTLHQQIKKHAFCDSGTGPSPSVLSVASSLITESNISFAKSSICLAMDDKGYSLFATCERNTPRNVRQMY
jgi:hypothetical protein